MLQFLHLSILSILLAYQASAQEQFFDLANFYEPPIVTTGSGSTGGGFAVSCPATPVSEESLTLLDLYEANKNLNFELAKSTGDLKEDYFNSVDRTYTIQGEGDYAEAIREEILEDLVVFFQHVVFVDTPSELPIADDLGPSPALPSQCSLKQIAFFDDQAETVYILKTAWEKLDSFNQSALVHHEIGGAYYRQLGEGDSRPWRNAVAHIYAKEGEFLPINHQIGMEALSYSSQSLDKEMGPNTISTFISQKMYGPQEVRRIQFNQLFGRPVLAKTWIDIPFTEWKFEPYFIPGDDQQPSHVKCILETQGIDSEDVFPVQGTMATGAEVRVTMKTGYPIVLSLWRHNQFLAYGIVKTGGNCTN